MRWSVARKSSTETPSALAIMGIHFSEGNRRLFSISLRKPALKVVSLPESLELAFALMALFSSAAKPRRVFPKAIRFSRIKSPKVVRGISEKLGDVDIAGNEMCVVHGTHVRGAERISNDVSRVKRLYAEFSEHDLYL